MIHALSDYGPNLGDPRDPRNEFSDLCECDRCRLVEHEDWEGWHDHDGELLCDECDEREHERRFALENGRAA